MGDEEKARQILADNAEHEDGRLANSLFFPFSEFVFFRSCYYPVPGSWSVGTIEKSDGRKKIKQGLGEKKGRAPDPARFSFTLPLPPRFFDRPH